MSTRDRVKVARLSILRDQADRIKKLSSEMVGRAIFISQAAQEGIDHFSQQGDGHKEVRHRPAPTRRRSGNEAEEIEEGWVELHKAAVRIKELLDRLKSEVASLTRS